MRNILLLLAIGVAGVYGQAEIACVGVPNGNFVNNPQSCAHFYFCQDNQAHPNSCEYDFLFHPIDQICDFPDNVDCTQCSPMGVQTLQRPGFCSTFILCSNGLPTIGECSAGLHFNPSTGSCSIPAEANCPYPGEPEIPPPGGETPLPPPPPPPPPPGGEVPDCSGAQIYFAHPTDCRLFFFCHNGAAVLRECAEGFHWNQFRTICDLPENSGCVAQQPTPVPTPAPPPTPPPTETDPPIY